MNLKENIKIVLLNEKTKNDWKNNHSSKEWKLANQVAIVVMGEGLQRKRNCGCVDDLLIMLKSLNEPKIKLKQTQIMNKFEIKEGKMIQLHGLNDAYTNANLTDEKAIEILKKFPKAIAFFSKHPDNWQELCGKDVPNEIPGAEENEEIILNNEPTEGTRADELAKESDEVLKKLCNDLAEEKGLKKVHWKSASEKLIQYIIDNE